MEDFQNMINQMINHGYCITPGNRKAIYDLDIYDRDQQEIMKNEYPDQFSSFSFAVFRATLYNWKLGKDLETDYELYKRFLRNRALNELRSCTFLLPEILKVKSKDTRLMNRFKEDLVSPKKPFIICSFHYSCYKVLINYLINHEFNICMMASNGIIDQYKNDSEFYVQASNQISGRHAAIKYISAEDFNSMLTLAGILSDENLDPKTVFLIFPDGNIGSKRHIDKKRFEPILFLNKELWVRKGIFMFAELFNIPIYHVLADADTDHHIYLEVLSHIENPKLSKYENKNTLQLFYNILENILSYDNLHKWECWMYIHGWHEHQVPPAENRTFISEKNYEKDRFTFFITKEDQYVFDSKYYLSYPIDWDGSEPFMSAVKRTNIIL